MARSPRVKIPFRERYRTSRTILGQSFRMLSSERDLWVFPAVSVLTLLAGGAALALGGLIGGKDSLMTQAVATGPWAMAAMMMVIGFVLYPASVVIALFQAALVFAAHERMEGRPGTKREALRRAFGQLGPIARFTLVASLVTGIFTAVGQFLDRLRIVPYLGSAIQMVGLVGWATASFFVVPVLVVERERRALSALKASVHIAREQWGKSVSGMVTISLAFMVPVFALLGVFVVATFGSMYLAFAGVIPIKVLLGVMIAGGAVMGTVLLALMVLSMATQSLYQTALYRYARTGIASLPYTPETLVDAWAPYQK